MTTTEIMEMTWKIADIKGMTVKEYQELNHKIASECEKISIYNWHTDEIRAMLYNTLVKMLMTFEDNYFSQNRKFHNGDIVRYKDRLCKVEWAMLSRLDGDILYELTYANGKGMPRTESLFHENELTLVKAAEMEDC